MNGEKIPSTANWKRRKIICEYLELRPAKTSGNLADLQGVQSSGMEYKF
jgi:hypothetical protein